MKYWVFDLDGTLTDSFAPYFSTVEHYLGTSLSREEKKTFIGMHPSQIFHSRLSSDEATHALKILKEKSQKDAASIPLFSEMYAICSWLNQNGRRISVWTSRDLDSAKLVLKETGISQFIDHIISGDCVVQRKPHPEGLTRIQSLFSCESHEMVMVGDHDHDMEAAKAMGVLSIRASWHTHWDHNICHHAHKQFYTTSDFQAWVKQNITPAIMEVQA